MRTLLIVPRIRVQNANAFSSAISVGFPAVTGFMGAVHALERKARDKGFDVRFGGVGIISHNAQVQTLQHAGAYQKALIGKAHPINKDGSAKSFVPDARVHITVSLVVECELTDDVTQDALLDYLSTTALHTIRIAGGDVLGLERPYFALVANSMMEQAAINKLMPGYALVDRSELMRTAMQDGQDAIDALLDFLEMRNTCESSEFDAADESPALPALWQRSRKMRGWLVPVGVGFQGLTTPGKAKHVRDDRYPHRFAESVVSLGEFKMVHKVCGLNELLWHYDTEAFNNLYLCVSKQALRTSLSSKE